MKISFLLISSLVFLTLLQRTSWAGQDAPGLNQPFSVVELFASEGCSSCPPADALLRELTRVAREQGKRIFTLSFQVDYWNDLGWVDPFSNEQFTRRQYRYADILQSSSVYTPQMVINGTRAFVGSRADLVKQYIDESLKMPASNAITLKITNNSQPQIEASYRCRELTPDAVLNFALVERDLENNVTRGENAGRILKHDNIVRGFKSIPLKEKEGVVGFRKPVVDDLSHFSIIAYVQDARNMKIVAADSTDLAQGK